MCTTKCQKAWDQIKQKYMEAPILILPIWQLEFRVHTHASLLEVHAMLVLNLTGKYDQLIVYASRLFNKAKQNYTTIEREASIMVYALHKFRHFVLGNKFVFYVDHMALAYLVNKPHVLRRIARQFLLFLEYDLQQFTNLVEHMQLLMFYLNYQTIQNHWVSQIRLWMHNNFMQNQYRCKK